MSAGDGARCDGEVIPAAGFAAPSRRPSRRAALAVAAALGCVSSLDLDEGLACAEPSRCVVASVPRCVDLQTDTAHCGACGRACEARPHAVAVCAGGRCGTACEAGWLDCDGDADDGCETDAASTSRACGACGRACEGTRACGGGVCGLADIALGRAAAQSSTFDSGCVRGPAFAVDGRWCGIAAALGGERCEGECENVSATRSEDQAWWEVDLGADVAVERVEVWTDRGFGAYAVQLSSDHASWRSWEVARAPAGAPTIREVGARGRWVRIRLRSFGAVWLREVVVAGSDAP